MPALARPKGLSTALFWFGAIILLGTFFGGAAFVSGTKGVLLWISSLGCGVAAIALAVFLTRPLAVCPAGTCRTVGDLTRVVFDMNAGVLARSAGEANREEIWRSLTALVAEVLAVRVKDITPATRFVEDLNCG